ncbi:MAG: tetratricopeptide repeat protein, partial [Bacteroidota bacterium]
MSPRLLELMVRRTLTAILGLSLMVCSYNLFGQPSATDQEALALAEQGNFVEAAQMYTVLAKQAESQSKEIEYWLLAGNQFRRARSNEEAFNAFQQVILADKAVDEAPQVDSMCALAFHQIGILQHVGGNLPEAIVAYSEAVKLRDQLYPVGHNDQARSRYNLAISLRSLGKMDSAEFLLQEGNQIYAA